MNKDKKKQKEYNKKYYELNKEKIKKQVKEYVKNNKEKVKKQKKIYSQLNKENLSEYGKKWRKNNREKKRIDDKKYREDNKERLSELGKKWRKENKEDIKTQQKEYYELNKEKIKKQVQKYRENPHGREKIRIRRLIPKNRLNNNISRGIRQSITTSFKNKNLSKNRRHWEDIVGYTVQELTNHIENLFTKGMTWNNYGKNGWHLDHIIPISFFVYTNTDDVEFKYCWSLNNLQPLWEKDNIKKGDKIILWEKEINARDRDYRNK
jgi:hypothetical protein